MSDILAKFNLKGRTALVTGGAGLLGREFCRTLAQAGAQVVIADLNVSSAQAYAKDLKNEGLTVFPVSVDVKDSESVQSMLQMTLTTFQRLDILVNSAAMDPKFDNSQQNKHPSRFEDYPLASWKQALDVNLTGMFLCCQAAARQMLVQKSGSIVNICSTYGLVGPDQRIYRLPGKAMQYKPAFYSATKAGALGLTRYLATYFAGQNIRVNALTPGGVYNNHEDAFVQNYSAHTVLGRMAQPDEMNGALLFLASEASSYMTGANLIVDGGWTSW
ncbi:MAG: SDR family oxidoreductase [Kiritimatiellia bacterium]|jgi:2-deoxy-D-gluconate 3-dehydrogenase